MDFSASAATKDAARLRRRRFCTPPRFFSTLPHTFAAVASRRSRDAALLRRHTRHNGHCARLIIASGEVVDDAIVDVENTVRPLRPIARCRTAPAFEVVLDASLRRAPRHHAA
jgi:hypothetical protein